MRSMLSTMRERLTLGEALVLVTITAASGATPRGTGARMLVGQMGRISGTIGGGAVEYRAEQIALQVLEGKLSRQQEFSLNREDVQELGMICGGAVKVFFHYIPENDEHTIALTLEAERIFDTQDPLWLLSDITNDGKLSLYSPRSGIFGGPVPDCVISELSRVPKLVEGEGFAFCVEQISSPGRVYIFGGGHVSQELEPILTRVGFRCIVMDDRSEFARRELFPTAEEVKTINFTQISHSVSLGPDDYVCIMTRGHAYDTVLQAQVLRSRPCYVGVIGSKKKAATVRQILKTEYGISEEELDRITTPIGIEIEAETPAEIAISIAAQMIHVRAEQRRTEKYLISHGTDRPQKV